MDSLLSNKERDYQLGRVSKSKIVSFRTRYGQDDYLFPRIIPPIRSIPVKTGRFIKGTKDPEIVDGNFIEGEAYIGEAYNGIDMYVSCHYLENHNYKSHVMTIFNSQFKIHPNKKHVILNKKQHDSNSIKFWIEVSPSYEGISDGSMVSIFLKLSMNLE